MLPAAAVVALTLGSAEPVIVSGGTRLQKGWPCVMRFADPDKLGVILLSGFLSNSHVCMTQHVQVIFWFVCGKALVPVIAAEH